MHPRISVSQVSSWSWTLDEDLDFYEAEGIRTIGVLQRKLEETGDPMAAARYLARAGYIVTNLIAPNPFTLDDRSAWPAQQEKLDRTLALAAELRPQTIVLPAGRAGALPWERAADELDDAIRSSLAQAQAAGQWMLLEPTNPLRTDLGFVHTLRDALDLGWRLGMGVCLEVTACWYERNLAGVIDTGVAGIGLVQLSDYAIGTHRTPDRCVPGDGDIPLERIVRQLVEAGYEGAFDIELRGPRIDREGYDRAILRSVAYVDALLAELGVKTAPELGS